ncbi:MAG: class I SAM-dependent RNA methyltransferase [Acidobacteria bacterium]|nr:class I SAM-dependent RNA methyltransferase [Acidobacteriota bacterium]
MLATNDLVELTIEKPAAGGRMIARHEGQVILVSGAIPGERVSARVERADKTLAYAAVVDILEPHRARRLVAGDWTCGGNVYAFIDYPHQLAIKADVVRDAFARLARLPLDRDVPVTGSREDGYRMRARFQVMAGRVGFFREGTHELCESGATGQLLPETSRVIAQVSQRLRQIDPEGVLAIELSENIPGGERAIHLQLRPAARVRTTVFGPIAGVRGITGATCQLASGAPVVRLGGVPLVGDELSQVLGVPAARFGDVRVERSARAFFQGNRYLLPRLVQAVLAWVPAEGEVLDLYAGVGLFALALAATGREQVTAVEGDRISGADLVSNARKCGGAMRVEVGSVEGYLARRQGARAPTIIVDPPRTGLSRDALRAVLSHGATRLVYVSCDIATLARDVRQAVDAGYALAHLEAFDLFPNTAHVETLAVLQRAEAS